MKEKKKKDNNKIDRRQFLEKVASATKYLAVGAISSELIEFAPTLKSERPDLLPGGEGDYEGV